jgi:hypothetical protein
VSAIGSRTLANGPACTLLVFIDDATSTLMHLEFVSSESTFSYSGALERYLTLHGRPVAFYSDRHTVFRVPKQGARTGHGMTQFGRALNELNIGILCANSSQAEGRVERANRTLQDRLVTKLRLAGISDMETANAFVPGFMARHNAQFARPARRSDNLHRPLNVEPDRLRDILCYRDERYVSSQLALSHDRLRSSWRRTRSPAICRANTWTAMSSRTAGWSSAGRVFRCPTPSLTRISG